MVTTSASAGDILEHHGLGRQQARGHRGQRRVLGGADPDLPREADAALDHQSSRHQQPAR